MPFPIIEISYEGVHFHYLQGNIQTMYLFCKVLNHPNLDLYLLIFVVLLLSLASKQLHAFTRPPPVQKKRLPKRPILQIVFKPDEISTPGHQKENYINEDKNNPISAPSINSATAPPLRSCIPGIVPAYRLSRTFAGTSSDQNNTVNRGAKSTSYPTTENRTDVHTKFSEDDDITWNEDDNFMTDQIHPDRNYQTEGDTKENRSPASTQFVPNFDNLPDSFAPLISSSNMEILTRDLSTDLLHAIHAEGNIRLRPGRFEIPLDKDPSRPQLILDIPSSGCKITAVGIVGSDGFTSIDDLNPSICTSDRSLPMVKRAGLVLDPPLPLSNVAPTLIHFPTLFEDNLFRYKLRRIQIVRLALDFIYSASSFIEKLLWIVESKCQIHLGKVTVTPLYKGSEQHKKPFSETSFDESEDDITVINRNTIGNAHNPQWRLSLSFSGHLLFFGWIPVPFVSVTLPTFIIPQPHALMEFLLSAQPLASARLRRERISETAIILATLDAVDSWRFDVDAVATPPALSVDWTLPGGLAVAVEAMHGRDVTGGRARDTIKGDTVIVPSQSGETLSSWTTYPEAYQKLKQRRNIGHDANRSYSLIKNSQVRSYDANHVVPWKLELSMQGYISHERVYVSISKFIAKHEPQVNVDGSLSSDQNTGSRLVVSGSLEVWRPSPGSVPSKFGTTKGSTVPQSMFPSVCSTLLFQKAPVILHSSMPLRSKAKLDNFLEYDYAFDIGKETCLDALSLSIGASHPMLKGGTIITTIIESIYAHGSMTAREGALLDMNEIKRKRYVLRHLPAVDFTAGIQNAYIPEESMSYSDDGQTMSVPKLNGGRLLIRVIGGFTDDSKSVGEYMTEAVTNVDAYLSQKGTSNYDHVLDGIKVVIDFGVGSLVLSSESNVTEIPELEIFEDQRLETLLSGSIYGRISCHLRPQDVAKISRGSLGKNVFNPLEAYEIDFSGSAVSFTLKEGNSTLGHRRVIYPTESMFGLSIQDSVVDMALDGTTHCEFRWDFQGSSPILQVVPLGQSPVSSSHEEKQQIALLIPSLRQGRFNLSVSPVGGLKITEAKTTRENRDGLYDWKFFNALVSPDENSPAHLFKVIHDKRTMSKLLQIIKLINSDLEKISTYILQQVWRAKEIFDQEGVSDPGKAIPGHQMSRLISLFLSGDTSQVNDVIPIVRRVVSGEGLDVMKVKDLLHKNVSFYENWAPEIDRAVRWFEALLGPMEAPRPYVENEVPPLSESSPYVSRFGNIPPIRVIYATLLDRTHLPLDPNFSHLLGRVAPYLSFRQVEYILQTRPPCDWRSADLRRLRYVYSIKKKVLEISESYGGLTFLPQSFFVSVFVAEATRSSLRAWDLVQRKTETAMISSHRRQIQSSTLFKLRKQRTYYHPGAEILSADSTTELNGDYLSPAGRVASQPNILESLRDNERGKDQVIGSTDRNRSVGSELEPYEIGDSLLGPQDVAILLQAGLTSSMKGSTVVQLNQRMLLDLMASQPKSFAIAVLAEIGSPGGQGSLRGLTSALMALLDLDQNSFTSFQRLDMHALLESWISGIKIPRREDYLAGGRWARQSYYSAILNVAKSILDDAEIYLAFKGHLQRMRQGSESTPVPLPRECLVALQPDTVGIDLDDFSASTEYIDQHDSKFMALIRTAKQKISDADRMGVEALHFVLSDRAKDIDSNQTVHSAKQAYRDAFDACAEVLKSDKLGFQAEWFKNFYRRNYDALMVKSLFDNIMDDVDDVREWCARMSKGLSKCTDDDINPIIRHVLQKGNELVGIRRDASSERSVFLDPHSFPVQHLLDCIIDLLFYYDDEKERIRIDPLVRLLISNPDGQLDFTIVTAMGVITEGRRGLELADAFDRLDKKRGIKTIRADTGTARSLEYNAAKIEEAIEAAVKMNKPYGLLGYSQGCANALAAESLLWSGSPLQQSLLTGTASKLICRQLMFSAANGSTHGPSMEAKIHRLIIMGEEFFKYQQGYFSKAFISFVLETLTNIMDSAAFQKVICGGGGTFLPEGCRAFWREAQHMPHIPTCVLRGVLENHTTPESLEMISNLLTKQSGSPLHDSQVHVYDAVGYPVYTQNRNGKILKSCDMGGAVQRTHHWSPLSSEVEFVRTKRDVEQGSFLCAKDRHVFPWVEVNARFGIIKYNAHEKDSSDSKM